MAKTPMFRRIIGFDQAISEGIWSRILKECFVQEKNRVRLLCMSRPNLPFYVMTYRGSATPDYRGCEAAVSA